MIFIVFQILALVAGLSIFFFSALELDKRLTLMTIILLFPVSLRVYFDHQKLRKKEEEFFNFVRDLALNIKTGMTLRRAIEIGSSGEFGALGDEIEHLIKQIEIGMPIETALKEFGNNQKSRLIKRSVSLINVASRSGGKISDTLSFLSSDLLRIKNLREEMKSTLQVYCTILYIVYFTYLAIVLLSLLKILPSMKTAGLEVDLDYFKQILFRSSVILGAFTSLMAGKIMNGSIYSGLIHSVIMISICFLVFLIF